MNYNINIVKLKLVSKVPKIIEIRLSDSGSEGVLKLKKNSIWRIRSRFLEDVANSC